MSESSQQKTTRKFVTLLSNNYFRVQISIFYRKLNDSLSALEHKPIITDQLRRAFPNQCFLYRLCLFNVNTKNLDDMKTTEDIQDEVKMPYHTVFTHAKVSIDRIEKILRKHIGNEIFAKQRFFVETKKEQYISVVKKGKPYDLHNQFNSKKPIQRYSIIGEKNISDY
jgi:hypothetical protein